MQFVCMASGMGHLAHTTDSSYQDSLSQMPQQCHSLDTTSKVLLSLASAEVPLLIRGRSEPLAPVTVLVPPSSYALRPRHVPYY